MSGKFTGASRRNGARRLRRLYASLRGFIRRLEHARTKACNVGVSATRLLAYLVKTRSGFNHSSRKVLKRNGAVYVAKLLHRSNNYRRAGNQGEAPGEAHVLSVSAQVATR